MEFKCYKCSHYYSGMRKEPCITCAVGDKYESYKSVFNERDDLVKKLNASRHEVQRLMRMAGKAAEIIFENVNRSIEDDMFALKLEEASLNGLPEPTND